MLVLGTPPLAPPGTPSVSPGVSRTVPARKMQKLRRLWGDVPWKQHAMEQGLWNGCFMGMDQYLLIPFLGGWTSINPSYFDVNYRGTRFWHTALFLHFFGESTEIDFIFLFCHWKRGIPSNFQMPVAKETWNMDVEWVAPPHMKKNTCTWHGFFRILVILLVF